MIVVGLVSINHTDSGSILRDVTSDPNDEPWFHLATSESAYRRYDIITKDGISYRYVALGTYPNLDTRHFVSKEQSIIQEAIKNYVNEL